MESRRHGTTVLLHGPPCSITVRTLEKITWGRVRAAVKVVRLAHPILAPTTGTHSHGRIFVF